MDPSWEQSGFDEITTDLSSCLQSIPSTATQLSFQLTQLFTLERRSKTFIPTFQTTQDHVIEKRNGLMKVTTYARIFKQRALRSELICMDLCTMRAATSEFCILRGHNSNQQQMHGKSTFSHNACHSCIYWYKQLLYNQNVKLKTTCSQKSAKPPVIMLSDEFKHFLHYLCEKQSKSDCSLHPLYQHSSHANFSLLSSVSRRI